MEHLFGFGQPIISEQPIPGALARDPLVRDRAPPLSIKVGPQRPDHDNPLYRRDGNALLFSPGAVGQYRCHADLIELTTESDCDSQTLSELLISTALPAALWMQGHFVLHAAGVVLPGRDAAIAVSGISGSGKSTSAAALLERNARLLGDDSLSLKRGPGGWRAAGLPGGLFQVKANGTGREFVPISSERTVPEAGLDAIFVLGQRAAVPAIRRLDGPAAAGQLLAMQHRPQVPALLGLRGEVLRMAVGIARTVPIFSWQRGIDRTGLDDAEWDFLLRSCSNER